MLTLYPVYTSKWTVGFAIVVDVVALVSRGRLASLLYHLGMANVTSRLLTFAPETPPHEGRFQAQNLPNLSALILTNRGQDSITWVLVGKPSTNSLGELLGLSNYA